MQLKSFLYSIPMPLSHLLNESRVREVIVEHGWKEGFKALFYSDDKIRNIERENLMQSSRPENNRTNANATNADGFNGVLEQFMDNQHHV